MKIRTLFTNPVLRISHIKVQVMPVWAANCCGITPRNPGKSWVHRQLLLTQDYNSHDLGVSTSWKVALHMGAKRSLVTQALRSHALSTPS